MKLINLSSLTDSELKSIAETECIDNYEDLSRDELIEELENTYEDNEDNNYSGTLNQKYLNTLSPGKNNLNSLPGVEEIPLHYNKTFVYLVKKDASWAYVFWNLSDKDYKKIEQCNLSTLILRLTALKQNKNAELSYDIIVPVNDKKHIIELPWDNRLYQVILLMDTTIEKTVNNEDVLCKSNTVKKDDCWLKSNNKSLLNPDRYEVLIKPLISADGMPVNCLEIKNMIYNISILSNHFSVKQKGNINE